MPRKQKKVLETEQLAKLLTGRRLNKRCAAGLKNDVQYLLSLLGKAKSVSATSEWVGTTLAEDECVVMVKLPIQAWNKVNKNYGRLVRLRKTMQKVL